MGFESKVTIAKPRKEVWQVLINIKTWKTWYGGELIKVDPIWQKGSKLKWANGGSSEITEYISNELIVFGDSVKSRINITDNNDGSTTFVYSESVGGSLSVSNPSAKQKQCDSTAEEFKNYAENSRSKIEYLMIEATTLDDARLQLKNQLDKNYFLISEEIIDSGGNKKCSAYADTLSKAFLIAENKIPQNSIIIERKEVSNSNQKTIIVNAFNEEHAKKLIMKQITSNDVIKDIKLTLVGSKGFLGIGKKPNSYESIIFIPAEVEMIYNTKAKITVKIGKDIRNSIDKSMINISRENNKPIDVYCDICRKKCKALIKPLEPGTIITMTPEIAIIASHYCENCNIIMCGTCARTSSYTPGLHICPRCAEDTEYAAIPHLRMTETKVVASSEFLAKI